MHYLLSGTTYLGIGQIIAASSGFILTIVLVKILDQVEYGTYSYLISVAGIVGIFTLTGMDIVVAQSIARGATGALRVGFWRKFTWSLPAAGVALIVGFYYLFKENTILGYSLLAISLTTPLLYASSLYSSYWNGKKQFKKLALDNALRNILITLSIILTAYLTHDVLFVVFAYLISNTLISAIRFYLLERTLPEDREHPDPSGLSLGKHLSLMDILGNVSLYVDKLIVFQYLGATQLAFYALALAPIKQLQSASRIVRALVLPKFSVRSEKELRKTIGHKVIVFFFVCLGLVVLYCVVAEYVFVYFFPEYEKALLYSQILSLSLLFMPSILHTQALTSLNRKRDLYIVNGVKSVSKIGMVLLFIPMFGVWGAILSFVLTQVITSGVQYALFLRDTQGDNDPTS